jgi:hypothetical protein
MRGRLSSGLRNTEPHRSKVSRMRKSSVSAVQKTHDHVCISERLCQDWDEGREPDMHIIYGYLARKRKAGS